MNRAEIAELLPAVFQRTLKDGSPLAALLQVMEALHAPSEEVLTQLDAIFDPRRTSDQFVSYLAYWADLTRLFGETPNSKTKGRTGSLSIASGLGPLRELIAKAAYLSQWRGTRKGLLLFLQTATGMKGFEIAENIDLKGQPRQFHISVRGPKESEPYSKLIERIVELEKPAYVTYELAFTPAGGQ